jgi:hypothetical protein
MTLIDLRPGLRAYLLADAAISTAVGGARVYPLRLPQGQLLPSVVYQRVSGQGVHHNQGPSVLTRPRLQIDCWAADPDAAAALADLVKERLDGFRGPMPFGADSPPATVTVQGIFFEDERDLFDADAQLYRVSRDYWVWFEER